MEKPIERLTELLQLGREYFRETQDDLLGKPSETAWSKQEILGHLIDSAIHNLTRFTEIQFQEKPYKVKSYDPDGWVAANHYQEENIQELVDLWIALNERIIHVLKFQTEDTLNYSIFLPDHLSEGEEKNLKFLIDDYINHLEHHLKQIGVTQ